MRDDVHIRSDGRLVNHQDSCVDTSNILMNRSTRINTCYNGLLI